MFARKALPLAMLLGLMVVIGCLDEWRGTAIAPPPQTEHQQAERLPTPDSFPARLLEIARDSQAIYGLLTPEMKSASVVPEPMRTEGEFKPPGYICDFNPSRISNGITPAKSFTTDLDIPLDAMADRQQMKFSKSADRATHGRKLYLVLSRYPVVSQLKSPYPVGQAVVKESWTPEVVADTPENWKSMTRLLPEPSNSVTPKHKPIAKPIEIVVCTRVDGKVYRASRKFGYFIMFKVDPKTPETDEGWVYGTVSADGKEVLSVGKLNSCMKCHEDAPRDRIFGL